MKLQKKFKQALEALPEQIEVLKSIEVGLNENPAETWDLVLVAIVEKMEDVEVYAKHPAHVASPLQLLQTIKKAGLVWILIAKINNCR